MRHIATPQLHVPSITVPSRRLALMLAVATLALLGLAFALAAVLDDDISSGRSPVAIPSDTVSPAPGVRYDGGPEEGSAAIGSTKVQPLTPGVRYDGGPEEGSAAIGSATVTPSAPAARPDGGPEEGAAVGIINQRTPGTGTQGAAADRFHHR